MTDKMVRMIEDQTALVVAHIEANTTAAVAQINAMTDRINRLTDRLNVGNDEYRQSYSKGDE